MTDYDTQGRELVAPYVCHEHRPYVATPMSVRCVSCGHHVATINQTPDELMAELSAARDQIALLERKVASLEPFEQLAVDPEWSNRV